jgi:hypothetical protein
MVKKRGQKICSECGHVNGVRTYNCKNCDHPFKMKKGRKTPRKKLITDHTELKKGDTIRVVGGSGPYYTDKEGERHYLTDRGKYKVEGTDNQGIRCYGPTGYCYLYMGKKCRSSLLDNITKAPHKILLLQNMAPLRRT